MIVDLREHVSKIDELLEEKDYRVLRSYLSEFEPADIAEIFDKMHADDIPLLFRILPKDLASDHESAIRLLIRSVRFMQIELRVRVTPSRLNRR